MPLARFFWKTQFVLKSLTVHLIWLINFFHRTLPITYHDAVTKVELLLLKEKEKNYETTIKEHLFWTWMKLNNFNKETKISSEKENIWKYSVFHIFYFTLCKLFQFIIKNNQIVVYMHSLGNVNKYINVFNNMNYLSFSFVKFWLNYCIWIVPDQIFYIRFSQ